MTKVTIVVCELFAVNWGRLVLFPVHFMKDFKAIYLEPFSFCIIVFTELKLNEKILVTIFLIAWSFSSIAFFHDEPKNTSSAKNWFLSQQQTLKNTRVYFSNIYSKWHSCTLFKGFRMSTYIQIRLFVYNFMTKTIYCPRG